MSNLRWAWAEIDLSAVAHNVAFLKGRTRPGTAFMAVVKADGYGHGAVPVARAALGAGADRLGVATISEAVELREAGLDAPVQLLSEPPEAAIDLLFRHDIVPAVVGPAFARALGERGAALGRRSRVHLKIDTGMNRTGVAAGDAPAFARALVDHPGLSLEGTFTHLATADVPGDPHASRQLSRFRDAIAGIRAQGVDPGVVHAANSAATVLRPDAHFDMVRCGIAIYGLHPAADTCAVAELRPAMSVKARPTLVKRIAGGEGVSYGLTWIAAAPTTVATLPIGYADGIHRLLSNRMSVLIGGRRCRQVGRVCMDQLIVEIPEGVEARAGDEAVLVGTQHGESIALDELARSAGTINYELACGFGLRLERVVRDPSTQVR